LRTHQLRACIVAHQQVRFLLDTMLGRLGRWLRCLGIDAQSIGQSTSRQGLIMLAAQVRRHTLDMWRMAHGAWGMGHGA
jgi:hypothetical protein